MPNSNWKWKYQNFPQNKSHSGAQFQLQNVTGFWENPSQNLGVGRNQSWEKIEIHVANVIGFPMFWKWRRVSGKTNHKLAVSFILALWFLFGRWICPWKNSNGKVWRVSRETLETQGLKFFRGQIQEPKLDGFWCFGNTEVPIPKHLGMFLDNASWKCLFEAWPEIDPKAADVM